MNEQFTVVRYFFDRKGNTTKALVFNNLKPMSQAEAITVAKNLLQRSSWRNAAFPVDELHHLNLNRFPVEFLGAKP